VAICLIGYLNLRVLTASNYQLVPRDLPMQSVGVGSIAREKKKPYYKPVRLRKELKTLFEERPVLTPQQAWLKLREMREPDGARTFCVSQAGSVRSLAKDKICIGCKLNPCTGCRGKLLPVEDIKSDFSSQAQKRKANPAWEQGKTEKQK